MGCVRSFYLPSWSSAATTTRDQSSRYILLGLLVASMKRRGSTGSAGNGQKSGGRSSGRNSGVGSTTPPPPIQVAARHMYLHPDGAGAIIGPIDTLPKDYLSCAACSNKLLPMSSAWYILGACHHIVCPLCWGRHCNAKRGCRTYMTCPRTTCDSPHTYSFYVSDVKPIDVPVPDAPTDRQTRHQTKKAKAVAAAAQDGPPPPRG